MSYQDSRTTNAAAPSLRLQASQSGVRQRVPPFPAGCPRTYKCLGCTFILTANILSCVCQGTTDATSCTLSSKCYRGRLLMRSKSPKEASSQVSSTSAYSKPDHLLLSPFHQKWTHRIFLALLPVREQSQTQNPMVNTAHSAWSLPAQSLHGQTPWLGSPGLQWHFRQVPIF